MSELAVRRLLESYFDEWPDEAGKIVRKGEQAVRRHRLYGVLVGIGGWDEQEAVEVMMEMAVKVWGLEGGRG